MLYHEPSLHIDMRNSTRFPNMFISCCGRFIRDTNHANFVTMLNRNKSERYLYRITKYKKVYIHRLVALAWVYNPQPYVFLCIDHIDGDSQNNHATNLRWITNTLNALNRKHVKGYEKRLRKNGSVVYRSRVSVGKVRYDQYANTASEAIKLTKEMQINKFNELYNATLACSRITEDSNAGPCKRFAHHFLWTDNREGFPESRVETPEGSTDTDPGIRRYHPRRYPQFVVHN